VEPPAHSVSSANTICFGRNIVAITIPIRGYSYPFDAR
jgi:hypothetical protein